MTGPLRRSNSCSSMNQLARPFHQGKDENVASKSADRRAASAGQPTPGVQAKKRQRWGLCLTAAMTLAPDRRWYKLRFDTTEPCHAGLRQPQ